MVSPLLSKITKMVSYKEKELRKHDSVKLMRSLVLFQLHDLITRYHEAASGSQICMRSKYLHILYKGMVETKMVTINMQSHHHSRK